MPRGAGREQTWSVPTAGSRGRPEAAPSRPDEPSWDRDRPERAGARSRPADPAWFDGDVLPVESRSSGRRPRPQPPAAPPEISRTTRPARRPAGTKTKAAKAKGTKPGRSKAASRATRSAAHAPRRRPAAEWSKLAPVYDVEGAHIRWGVAWFIAVLPAVTLSTATTAVAFAIAMGLAARQTVQAWRGESWQADLAAGLAAVPVLAAVVGTGAALGAMAVAGVVAVGAGFQAPAAGLRGSTGRMAAAGILPSAILPLAVAGAAMVAVRGQSVAAAMLLFALASAYEMGDFLVGSAASNPIEGPLAGGAAVIVAGFPMALLLVEPFDVMGAALLGAAALCCPVGQWIASAMLPRPGATAPALRRVDTLLLLAPVWAVASGVF